MPMLHVKAAVSVFKDSLFDLVSNMSKYLRCFGGFLFVFCFFCLKIPEGGKHFHCCFRVCCTFWCLHDVFGIPDYENMSRDKDKKVFLETGGKKAHPDIERQLWLRGSNCQVHNWQTRIVHSVLLCLICRAVDVKPTDVPGSSELPARPQL